MCLLLSLDLRLNDFAQISVAEGHEPQLQRLMKAGTLQIDNVAVTSCEGNAELKQIRGLSQVFSVCVDSSTSSSAPTATADSSVAGEAADPLQTTVKKTSAVNTTELQSPGSASLDPSPVTAASAQPSAPSSSSSSGDAYTKTTADGSVVSSLFVTLIASISVVVVAVLSIACWLLSRRRVNEAAANDKPNDELRPTISLLASIMTDKNSTPSQNSSGESSSSLSSVAMLEAGQEEPRTDSSRIVLRSEIGYMNLRSPPMPSQANAGGGFTNASHSTEHDDVEVARRTRVVRPPVKSSRLADRKRLRLAVESLCGSHSIICVSGSEFRCCGPVEETPLAYIVPCVHANDQQHSTKLKLKLFIQQDVKHAANEYRAIKALREEPPSDSQSTAESMENQDESALVAPQLVAVDMDMALPCVSAEGVNASVHCSGLVLEATSATTLLHLVRGQMDKSSQLAVAQQLYSVLCALSSLHSQQFVHGSLHLEALVVDPDSGRLTFRDLEHARPFGAPMRSYARSAVEFVPPEMAIHLLCETAMMDPATQEELHRSTAASRRTSVAVVLSADPSFDVWSLGVLLLRMYASCKHLSEFRGCDEAVDVLLRVADPDFSLERSIELYVLHADVRDLIRQCLQRDPLRRPSLESVFEHPVFLNAVAVVSESSATRPRASLQQQNDQQLDRYLVEPAPPSLWMFLPPVEIGLDGCRSVDEWVAILSKLQQPDAQELHFPLLWVCESSWSLSTPCEASGLHNANLSVPASLLSIVVPLVQETTLFLEAKAILSHDATHSSRALHIGEVSGLGPKHWIELMKFYRALEMMLLAPVTSFSLLMLKPLEELLASGDPAAAQQVLDEVKCLSFSQEKRAHIRSLLELLVSPSTLLLGAQETEWCGLYRYELERETSLSMTSTRWLCRQHAP